MWDGLGIAWEEGDGTQGRGEGEVNRPRKSAVMKAQLKREGLAVFDRLVGEPGHFVFLWSFEHTLPHGAGGSRVIPLTGPVRKSSSLDATSTAAELSIAEKAFIFCGNFYRTLTNFSFTILSSGPRK